MPRPRKLNKVPHRVVGVSLPETEAERFDHACEALGMTKSDALKMFVHGFLDQHRDDIDRYRAEQARQERLPVAS